jgi:hypothetical protein
VPYGAVDLLCQFCYNDLIKADIIRLFISLPLRAVILITEVIIMNLTLQQTEKLLKDTQQKFALFAFSMMLTHLKETYAKNPSQSTLEDCNAEINKFLDKYKTIMVTDLAVIEKL